MGGLNLEQFREASIADDFQHWEKVATALEQKRMPPQKMPQPTDAGPEAAVTWIRAKLGEHAAKNAGDPGKVTVRRLTSGEYAYSIRDLTGLDWKFDADSGRIRWEVKALRTSGTSSSWRMPTLNGIWSRQESCRSCGDWRGAAAVLRRSLVRAASSYRLSTG